MSFFSGKVVIVTGSSNGIGRGTAVLFSKEGAKVAITGRDPATLEETKQLCLQAGANEDGILDLIGDVTDASFIEKLVAATVEKFGQIDVLVNNAGGASFSGFGKGVMDTPLAEFDKMIELNVKSVLRLSQLAVPHLVKTKGAIVNVSSIAAFHEISPMPYYSVAKSALDQATVQMAGCLIKEGVRVNSVNPGPVLTNAFATAGASTDQQDKMFSTRLPTIPLGRIGTPLDIGKLILFLADRSQSEILIGHILTADGGCHLKSAMFPEA
ncbi:hypothetical protein PMAYCL1PPCAC_16193 [Pristionchus mayeri]|uniref:Dehydrogenase n=1 Tax=Pristionchus mayeri TaxID=1317129 RepID=A0AAN5CKE8_9BILA|nr:hypothetical protein PMAYCL1PPCAC_16193 [Pristionchus mayeri]